jgi:hypothetical protein
MLKRHIEPELKAFLDLMPVVLVTGARQTGKTTLVASIGEERNIPFITFDDEFSLSNALRDPSGWIQSLPKPVIIDEVQRAPEIFLSIKRDVDQHREPGRYLLTGSANPLLLPKLGDSLAGRMGIVSMFPFSQGELKKKQELFIPTIFGDSIPFQQFEALTNEALYSMLLHGGFPSIQFLSDFQDVNRWVRSYLQIIMERDVRDIANIEGIREFPRLFQLLATRSGQLLNLADISRSLGMVNVTLNRYIRLLEILYFIHLLPSWFSNLGKRLTKAPKLHLCDSAIMGQLLGVDSKRLQEDSHLFGQFLESFVFSELLKQKSWSKFPFMIYHFRDMDHEVDFVLEKPDKTLIGIEVKSTRKIQADDLRGLKYLKNLAGNQFKRGIILHLGTQIESLGDDLWAMPIQSLWAF